MQIIFGSKDNFVPSLLLKTFALHLFIVIVAENIFFN
jgi:hypothetical protein